MPQDRTISSIGPTFETERLLLRPTRAEDFEPWAAFAADDVAMRFLGGAQPRSVAWRGFLSTAGAWAIQGFGMFSAIEKTTGRWIGRVGPLKPEAWPGAEVGWGLAREAWGMGYATEAASAAMDWAFEELGWTQIVHCIDPGNLASQSVAKRLGSRLLRRGRLPPPYEADEVEIWGQGRDQWRQGAAKRPTDAARRR
ncbi:MAG TPA: GNAT family N-acetyltransferase [Caulobacteraceae bacterium]